MIFCEKCFTNPEIIGRITHTSEMETNIFPEEGECPICKNKNVHLYNTDHRTGLNNIFDPLLDLYVNEEKLPIDFPEHEKKYLIEDLIINWNIFNQKLTKTDVESIIKNTSKEYFKNNSEILTKKVGIIDKINPLILSANALVKAKSWDDFVDELKTKNRFHTNSINENVLKLYCSYLEKTYEKGQKFYRGRISKTSSGFDISEMNAPPFELAKAGRVNAEGISHLYLANDINTTIHETRAGAYDIITVGTFELQKNITIIDFQKLEKIYPFSEDLDLLGYAINIEYLKRMNQEMSKTLRRDDSPLDYIPTQFIADYIKSFQKDDNYPLYRGIEYQSTMNRDGYNLVAFYPDDFVCVSVETVSVSNIKYNYNLVK
jgi:hypothetical protein